MKKSKIILSGLIIAGATLTLAACGSSNSSSKSATSNVKLPSLDGRYKPSDSTPAWKLDTKKK